MILWLFAIAFLLFALTVRERYQDPDSPVKSRPSLSGEWQSKIDAEAPIGGDDAAYVRALQAFYDKVYVPASTKPKDTDVEVFLKTADAQIPGIDQNALRKIISTAFRVERTVPSAAREEAQIKFKPTKALQPSDGVDQVFNRKELPYFPADSREGELPEGLYAPVTQQASPRNPGTWASGYKSWTPTRFYSVCKEGPCTENVL